MNKIKYIWVVLIIAMYSLLGKSFAQGHLSFARFEFSGQDGICVSENNQTANVEFGWVGPLPSTNNVFRVELSDANGDFSAPILLRDLRGGEYNSSLLNNIPVDFGKIEKEKKITFFGKGYKIRVVSTQPASEVILKVETKKEIKETFYIYSVKKTGALQINDGYTEAKTCPGVAYALTVKDADLDLRYKWYRVVGEGSSRQDVLIPNESSPTYMTAQPGRYYVKVDYDGSYCEGFANTKSNEVKVTTLGESVKLKINNGDKEAYICNSNGVELKANIADDKYIYNWYKDEQLIASASGEGKSTYVIPSEDSSIGAYFLEISSVGAASTDCKERSNVLNIKKIENFSVEIEPSGGGNIVVPGVPKTLTAVVKGAKNPTYQWYKIVNNKPVKIENATQSVYQIPEDELLGGIRYRVDVTDSFQKCQDIKKINIKLELPSSFEVIIGHHLYYEECKTNKTTLGVKEIRAVFGSSKYEIPKDKYDIFDYTWKKNDLDLPNKASELLMDNPSWNGDYKLEVSYKGLKGVSQSANVKLASYDESIRLESSNAPADGEGAVIYVCDSFTGETLKVVGTGSLAVSNYIWFKGDTKIAEGATMTSFTATSTGTYKVKIEGLSTCEIVTNSVWLRKLNIKVEYLNNNFQKLGKNPPVALLINNEGVNAQIKVSGISPKNSKVIWYKLPSSTPLQTKSGTTAGAYEYNITSEGDYYVKIIPTVAGCSNYQPQSETLKVVEAENFIPEIDYGLGSVSCNEVRETTLKLKNLKAEAVVESKSVTVSIPESDYDKYEMQWYKRRVDGTLEIVGGAKSSTLTISSENIKEAASYLLKVTYDGVAYPSNEKIAGVEKLSVTVKAQDTPDSDVSVICAGGEVTLMADVTIDSKVTALSDVKYQWYKGTEKLTATGTTLVVAEEGTYYVAVFGKVCNEEVRSPNQHRVTFFKKESVTFYQGDSDIPLDLSKPLELLQGNDLRLRVKGAKNYFWQNNKGDTKDIVQEGNRSEVTIKAPGVYNVRASIGGSCSENYVLEVEEVALPVELPTVLIAGEGGNAYWNLPPKYMQKENVRISIYTQDGVEVLSTVNYQGDSWPSPELLQGDGNRAVIYLYVIEIDGEVKDRGTITLIK